MSESQSIAYLYPKEQSIDPISISSYFVVGSDKSCDFKLDQPTVSFRHCVFEQCKSRFYLKDLKSEHGTWVNGIQIEAAYVKAGDHISIGQEEYIFEVSNIKKRTLAPSITSLSSKNPLWQEQLDSLERYAETDLPVLLVGESGCGKEVLSQEIHNKSKRRYNPFIAVNCGALSDSLIESELFGHIKGAFTGAHSNRKGAFESARGGTLFLDEIGELPLSLQPKLLRAIENKEIKAVGTDNYIQTDVRLITATHPNLHEKVSKGSFRLDLFHRLNILSLSPPPLRHRMEDFESFIYRFSKESRVRFSYEAIKKLKEHEWPGNIRELKNLVLRASATYPNQDISKAHLARLLRTATFNNTSRALPISSVSRIRKIEKELIVQRLYANRGSQKKTARDLGMPTSTLHDRIKAYEINPKTYQDDDDLALVSGL